MRAVKKSAAPGELAGVRWVTQRARCLLGNPWDCRITHALVHSCPGIGRHLRLAAAEERQQELEPR